VTPMPCVPVSDAARVTCLPGRRVLIEARDVRAIWRWDFEACAWERVY
jgi:hypothetical protein